MVDFGWGFNQVVMAWYLYFRADFNVVNNISICLISFWGLRLAYLIFTERVLKKCNDDRYEEMRAKKGWGKPAYYLFQFTLQAVLMLFPFSTVYFLFQRSNNYSFIYIIGNILAVSSIILEGISDKQLETYIKHKKETGDTSKGLCDIGFWEKSRHPNLFFEVMTWVSFAIMSVDNVNKLYAFIGPASIFGITYFITIPITERIMKKKRKNWDELIEGTNKFSIF